MIRFIRDPKNLRYSLNTIIPIIVFLTSILSAVITYRLGMSSHYDYVWIIGTSLFSSFCALLAVLAMTQPIKDLMKKAERMIRFEESRKEKGEMIEVYQLIERLMKLVTTEQGANLQEKKDIIEDIEKLDYIVPLGYMSLTVAHEVRNPLNTITGLSELLKEKMENREARVYVDRILEATKKIDAFTKELLDFTDDGIMEEEFDINVIVDETVQALSLLFKEVKCDFYRGDNMFYTGDKNKLYQAIFNIVKNAFEYENNPPSRPLPRTESLRDRPKGGMGLPVARLSDGQGQTGGLSSEKDGGYIRIETKHDDAVKISVYNRSSTLDKDDRESIFKPFFSKKKGGRGIGLFVSIRNVKLHGGNINVESGDEGTTLIITLPALKKG